MRNVSSSIEILEGLNVGDRVILSDTSQFDGLPAVARRDKVNPI
ncbi:MAG TPA: hypothetical protein VJ810_40390 [Blastocatellia bacterium]|nr:hypothetical protein [Blastocatellia bacterium]